MSGYVLQSILTTDETAYVLQSIEGSVQTTTLVTKFDAGNVDIALSSVTSPDTDTPTIYVDRRSATISSNGWRFLLFAVEGVNGKTPTFQLNRSTMWDRASSIPTAWLPCWTQDFQTWTFATTKTLVGGSTGTIEFSFPDPLPSGRVYVSTHPMQQNLYAATFANELLTDYSAVASPTTSGDSAGVYNVSPTENDEDGLAIGGNNQYAVQLEFGGSTTDGGPKRKAVIMAGIHAAGEHFSWLAFEAGIRWLLDSASASAVALRANFDFYLYFNLTPNGLKGGHGRWNFRVSTDPNRDWYNQTLAEIEATADAILLDTGGSADAMMSFHTFGAPTTLWVTALDTSPAPNAAMEAMIGHVETLASVTVQRETDNYTNTDFVWALDVLGCTVAFPVEMGMRAATAVEGVQAVGETWFEALQLTDADGFFYDAGALVEPTVAQSVSTAYDPVVSATPSVATVNPTAAVSISIAYDPTIETEAGTAIIYPDTARSFSVAYDPMVRGGVNITIPSASSVSQAYDPVVRIGLPRQVRRIIRQGQHITRLSFQGRI
jgi:hypothetical protein